MAGYGDIQTNISPVGDRIIMDTYILFIACLSFCLFLIIIAFLFRISRREEAINWMVRTFAGTGMVIAAVFVGSWGISEYAWWASIYGLLTVLFVFGPFSIMEASLTLRIVTEIARSGHIEANTSSIVKRRIARFLYSGEIIKNKGMFSRGRTSYFGIREVVLGAFRRLFP